MTRMRNSPCELGFEDEDWIQRVYEDTEARGSAFDYNGGRLFHL